jgi:hypothetical protein
MCSRPVTILLVSALLALATGCGRETAAPTAVAPLPESLAATGLFAADGSPGPGVRPFAPQYPLWTDGAAKRRWIRLPAGTRIDGTDPDAWVFPVGTMFWKEFAFGRRVETRTIERLADGAWRFAAYVWDAAGREARLAPEAGVRAAHEIAPGTFHAVPGRLDCLACHGGAVPVLGFSALQLSPSRDPLAPHAEPRPVGALDLAALREEGLLVEEDCLVPLPPEVAARTARERAALGYLHANCAACHREDGALGSLGLSFEVRLGAKGQARTLSTALGRAPHMRPHGAHEDLVRLHPGAPERSLALLRAGTRQASLQMPPLGTRLVDDAALELLRAWVREDLGAPIPDPTKE